MMHVDKTYCDERVQHITECYLALQQRVIDLSATVHLLDLSLQYAQNKLITLCATLKTIHEN